MLAQPSENALWADTQIAATCSVGQYIGLRTTFFGVAPSESQSRFDRYAKPHLGRRLPLQHKIGACDVQFCGMPI